MMLFVEIIFLAFLIRTDFFIIAIQSGTRSLMLLNSVETCNYNWKAEIKSGNIF